MADLLDIVPSTAVEVVKINGQRVTVRGLRVEAVASIVARFPNIVGLLLGGLSLTDIGPKFIQQFGAATGPIIAAGCGHLGDEKYEQHANTALLLEDQLRLVTAIIRATCPNGFGFFAEMLTKLNSAAGEEAKTVKSALEEIAIAITALIRRGFPPDYAMTLTPRQIAAYLEFNDRLDRIDRAHALTVAAIGAQGDSKMIEKTIKEISGRMPAKFKVTVDQPAWLNMIREKQRPVATAAVAALRDVAAESVQEGRSSIAAAGAGFTRAKWQSGLQYRTKDAGKDGEPSLQAKAIVFHKYGIAGVFEYGATIQGKPMLWIPTKHGAPTASRSGKNLTSATVRGQPMLFDADDKDRKRKPLYIGVPSVTIPKKFRVTEIVKEHVAKIAQAFLRHFKDN